MIPVFETVLASKEVDFLTSIQIILKSILEKSLDEISKQPLDNSEVMIAPYVVYAGYDPQKLVFRRTQVESPYHVTECIFFETMLQKPRYLALTMDSAKTPVGSDENGADSAEINTYLLFVFRPDKPDFTVYEYEYGLEDGGWVAEPTALPEGYFGGEMLDRIICFSRLYAEVMR